MAGTHILNPEIACKMQDSKVINRLLGNAVLIVELDSFKIP